MTRTVSPRPSAAPAPTYAACPLTPRQIQLLTIVVSCTGTSQAARKAGISPRTLERHLANIRNRLGEDLTTLQAVAIAVSNG